MHNKHVNDDTETIKAYLNELKNNKYKPIPLAVEKALVKEAKNGNKKSEKLLIEAHLRLVLNIAKKYKGIGIEMSDLIQEGNLGLYEALRRFDESKNIRYCVYAEWWVRNYMLKALNSNSNETCLSSINIVDDDDDIDMDSVQYESQNNKNRIQMTEEESDLDENEVNNTVEFLLSSLDDRMKMVIEHSYGLNGKEQLTMVELSKIMKITPERIRQIKVRAMMVLRTNALINSISIANLTK